MVAAASVVCAWVFCFRPAPRGTCKDCMMQPVGSFRVLVQRMLQCFDTANEFVSGACIHKCCKMLITHAAIVACSCSPCEQMLFTAAEPIVRPQIAAALSCVLRLRRHHHRHTAQQPAPHPLPEQQGLPHIRRVRVPARRSAAGHGCSAAGECGRCCGGCQCHHSGVCLRGRRGFRIVPLSSHCQKALQQSQIGVGTVRCGGCLVAPLLCAPEGVLGSAIAAAAGGSAAQPAILFGKATAMSW